jgi:Niemann-Pick C1 protein
MFFKWGTLCYRQPARILGAGIGIALVCSTGLFWLHFTTDPVDLWSAPGSRARVEKQFFDTSFG